MFSEQNKVPGEKWSLNEKVTTSTIKEYGIYQGKNFREALTDDSKRSDKKKSKNVRPRAPVRMAEVNDLTVPEQNYREHLTELHKLPPFMRICSAQNILTYCGQQHTKAQLLLTVPTCRVPPRHSVFAKVSLNVGPGDYEWFIGERKSPDIVVVFITLAYLVPEWWHVEFRELLCQQGKTFSDSWWPDLEACAKHSIPIYRFIQVCFPNNTEELRFNLHF